MRTLILSSKVLKDHITLIDLITRIFYLSDMNAGNFGVLYDDNDNIENSEIVFKGTKIIDFWIHNVFGNYSGKIEEEIEILFPFEEKFLFDFVSSNRYSKKNKIKIRNCFLKWERKRAKMNIIREYCNKYDNYLYFREIPKDFISLNDHILIEGKKQKIESGKIAFQILLKNIWDYHNQTSNESDFYLFKKILDDSKERSHIINV